MPPPPKSWSFCLTELWDKRLLRRRLIASRVSIPPPNPVWLRLSVSRDDSLTVEWLSARSGKTLCVGSSLSCLNRQSRREGEYPGRGEWQEWQQTREDPAPTMRFHHQAIKKNTFFLIMYVSLFRNVIKYLVYWQEYMTNSKILSQFSISLRNAAGSLSGTNT